MEVSSAQIMFACTLVSGDIGPLGRVRLEILQVNVGKLCSQACQHCHVDADRNGPSVCRAKPRIEYRATAGRTGG